MITVSTVPPDRCATALALLFDRFPKIEQDALVAEVLDQSSLGELSLDGLLVAEVNGQPVGAGLFVSQPDGTVFVWPPVVPEHVTIDGVADADSVTDAILQNVCRHLDTSEACIGQCLLDPDQSDDRETMTRNGFSHLADLIFMQRTLIDPLPPRSDIPFHTVTFDPAQNRDRFAQVLERTYDGTLDCPDFNERRTGDEALDSHQLVGRFDPARWKLFRVDDTDIGVLLLSEHPDQNACEVVYMGVVPEARGRGYGRGMLLTALYEAREAPSESVILAVDSQNTYARRLYEEMDFIEASVKAVHVRTSERGISGPDAQ